MYVAQKNSKTSMKAIFSSFGKFSGGFEYVLVQLLSIQTLFSTQMLYQKEGHVILYLHHRFFSYSGNQISRYITLSVLSFKLAENVLHIFCLCQIGVTSAFYDSEHP